MKYYVFDNIDKSLDRYTIILENGDLHSCSPNPFTEVGNYSHNVVEYEKKSLAECLAEVQQNTDWLGVEITDFTTLPKNVQQYIQKLIN